MAGIARHRTAERRICAQPHGTKHANACFITDFGATMSIDRIFRVLRELASPKLDLGIRLWLAQAFFVSGVLKLTHWQTALDLATNEYPVSWMSPVAAAYTGVSIELIV